MPFLSQRNADASALMQSLEKDMNFLQLFSGGVFDEARYSEVLDYVTKKYNTGEAQAEEAINHFLRDIRRARADFLSNRVAQADHIVVPPTHDNPTERRIPVVQKKQELPPPATGQDVTISAAPATTPAQKQEELSKSVNDSDQNRHQQLVNSAKAVKIAIGELAKAMYGIELSDENQDKVVSAVVEKISDCEAEQTSTTVKSLLSPLIKND